MSDATPDDEAEPQLQVFNFAAPEDAGDVDTKKRAASKRKRIAEVEGALKELPSSQMYEKSFMHKDTVTHVAVAAHDFILTASADGDLRFWKKIPEDVLFVKRYRSHKGPVSALEVSDMGDLCITMCLDGTAKVYDVATFDMIVMLRLDYAPGACAFIGDSKAATRKLAISQVDAPTLRIYDVTSGSTEAVATLEDVHQAPVTCMCFNAPQNTVISADVKGFVKYWHADTYRMPSSDLRFKSLFATDLMDCVKAACVPKTAACARDGSSFLLTCSDMSVRVYAYATGKCRRTLKLAMSDCAEEIEQETDGMEVARWATRETELRSAYEGCEQGTVAAPWFNAIFDESGQLVLYPAWRGVAVYCLRTDKVHRRLGEVESERYTRLALFQGVPKSKRKKVMEYNMGQQVKAQEVADPTLVAAALGKARFYLYSKREPEDIDDVTQGRDVFNEKPTEDELFETPAAAAARALPAGATIHTSLGDITFRLHGELCPRTVENFTTHARNGYYDGIIFHRIIKNFLIQTGDPLGDGTGGESIWGGEFEDEIVSELSHDRPGILSMANAGRNTNGSQFFVTTVPTPWLDGKHTVFGGLTKGMEVVTLIENAKVNKKTDKPWDDIKIVSISLLDSL